MVGPRTHDPGRGSRSRRDVPIANRLQNAGVTCSHPPTTRPRTRWLGPHRSTRERPRRNLPGAEVPRPGSVLAKSSRRDDVVGIPGPSARGDIVSVPLPGRGASIVANAGSGDRPRFAMEKLIEFEAPELQAPFLWPAWDGKGDGLSPLLTRPRPPDFGRMGAKTLARPRRPHPTPDFHRESPNETSRLWSCSGLPAIASAQSLVCTAPGSDHAGHRRGTRPDAASAALWSQHVRRGQPPKPRQYKVHDLVTIVVEGDGQAIGPAGKRRRTRPMPPTARSTASSTP